MKLDKNVFDQWTKWAEAIRRDLTAIVDDQQTFDGFREMVTANTKHIAEHHGRRFCDFVRRSYAIQAAVGVRRHLKKKDKKSISLLRLMEQIHECAEQFTYEFYLSCHPDDTVIDESWTACDAKEAEDFEKETSSPFTCDDKVVTKDQIANEAEPSDRLDKDKGTVSQLFPDGAMIARDLIANDIKAAEDLGKELEDFVDRQLAHLDKRGCTSKPTYDDLHKMIELFDDLACKYLELITGGSALSLKREIQFDWKEIFRVPLDVRT